MGIRGVEGPSLWFSLIGVLVFVSSGCSEPTASENRARLSTATFRLVRFDGRPLPVDEGPVPSLSGAASQCRTVVADGALAIDAERSRFIVYYSRRESCQGRLVSQPDRRGNFLRSGEELLLDEFTLDGNLHSLTARVHGDTIVVDWFGDHVLVFADPDTARPEVSGTFRLVRLEGKPIPLNPESDPAPVEPLIDIRHGSIDMGPAPGLEPWTGRFNWEYELVRAGTNDLAARADEAGNYEQIGRTLYFEAYPSPNVFHPFRGEVETHGGDIVLVIGMLVFE